MPVGRLFLRSSISYSAKRLQAEAAVDAKPVYERLFATFGGLGIIGANNLLRVPDRTNVRVFIGTLFVDADLPNVIHKAEDAVWMRGLYGLYW